MIWFHGDRALAAYLHGELAPAEQQRVERHLTRCPRCREAADRLRAVHAALPALPVCAAPDSLWQKIEAGLGTEQSATSNQAEGLSAAGAPVAVEGAGSDEAQGAKTLAGTATSNNRAGQPSRNGRNPEPVGHPAGARELRRALLRPAPARGRLTLALGSLAAVLIVGIAAKMLIHPAGAAWEVRTLQGRPAIGWFTFGARGKLRVNEYLSTDARSRAEIAVADIGTVSVAPGSRVRLVETGSSLHRLELEKGSLEASVVARPRLFVIDTHIGRAVDLGCAYRLETDGRLSTQVHVTKGQVELEDGGRSALVPRGFSCKSRHTGGLGTPVSDRASEALRAAIGRFDYEEGGPFAAEQARAAAGPRDTITLWHLLRRSPIAERALLYKTMALYSRPPTTVNRAGILAGNTIMLEYWKQSILYDLAEAELSR